MNESKHPPPPLDPYKFKQYMNLLYFEIKSEGTFNLKGISYTYSSKVSEL